MLLGVGCSGTGQQQRKGETEHTSQAEHLRFYACDRPSVPFQRAVVVTAQRQIASPSSRISSSVNLSSQ
jgi:hypothetical protein